MEVLRQNYADQPQLRFENVAISDKAQVRELFTLEFPDENVRSASPLSSFDRKHVERHAALDRRRSVITKFHVECTTLSELCRKHELSSIDLLQIDTEGFDAAIIRTIDFNLLKPRIIHYEHVCLPPQEQEQCLELLAHSGYRLCLEQCDTTAYLEADI